MIDFKKIDKKYACSCGLGAEYTKEMTSFAVWSPLAQKVALNLYPSHNGEKERTVAMTMDDKGVWRAEIKGNLDGKYYTYSVTYDGEENETADIYSRSSSANGRRSAIFSESSATFDGWENDRPVKLKSPTDAVIYELHVRDFSMDENADFAHRGKFLALTEQGVRNSHGDSAGLDYLKELGITHVHLLPVTQNASVDDENPCFNWGYDPFLYNVPEGSYCTDPSDAAGRVRELRRAVCALHDSGIGVVFDVVYNHTFSAEDSPFGRIFPHYYYRHEGDEYSNGSGCGNELATERSMAGKFICDSLTALVRDYHLDGIRFDLMGLMDIVTLNACAKQLRKINPDILLYGEGWTGGSSPLPENMRAVKINAKAAADVAMFSDDFRDGLKGSVFIDRDRGYISGVYSDERRELIKSVMCGGVFHSDIDRRQQDCWALSPKHSINYVEAHDNNTFWDKLALSMRKSDEDERKRVDKLGAALIFLSQGIPFIQAGQEFLRSKPYGSYLIANSYNYPDSVNSLKWDDVTQQRDIADYYRGLIAIRGTFPELRLSSAEDIRKIRFENLSGAALAMHTGQLVIGVNPQRRAAVLKLPEGEYELLADDETAGTTPICTVKKKISIKPQSAVVLRKCSS